MPEPTRPLPPTLPSNYYELGFQYAMAWIVIMAISL